MNAQSHLYNVSLSNDTEIQKCSCMKITGFYRLVHHMPLVAVWQKHQAARPHHTALDQNPTQAALKNKQNNKYTMQCLRIREMVYLQSR